LKAPFSLSIFLNYQKAINLVLFQQVDRFFDAFLAIFINELINGCCYFFAATFDRRMTGLVEQFELTVDDFANNGLIFLFNI
jgi:hypothetical protein